MSKSDSSENKDNAAAEVEVFNRVNRLKLKAGLGLNEGPGKINPEAVKRADAVVQDVSSLYPKEIKNMIKVMKEDWSNLKGMSAEGDRSDAVIRLSNTANQIKDLGTTFGYTLMGYFGESLRDFLLATDFSKEQHYVIVQAHVDVMEVVFREGLKDDDGGQEAEELKRVVAQAIEKYSTRSAEAE